MKNNLDHSYERARDSGSKKRRGFALLTVLSMIVTSGVVWGLRDTGVTMVNENEPQCSYEEHSHTDECYEKVLVCGMEESDEHTHSDECYELLMTCTLSEHIHQALCFNSDEADPEDIPVIDLDNVSDEEEVEYDELPELAWPSDIMPLAYPNTVSTFDQREDGIKINFFDYGDNTSPLEKGNNIWTNPDYSGINGGSWITRRDEKNNNTDLLFFAYGSDTGTYNANSGNNYDPGINNSSGVFNFNSNPPSAPVSGNRPVSNIVQPMLVGGYPVLNTAANTRLNYLFDPYNHDADGIRTDYLGVYSLMEKNPTTDIYRFISDIWYAELNKDSKEFKVYDGTYEIKRRVNAEYELHTGAPVGFFPFDTYEINERTQDVSHESVGSHNHHFGMTMEADFQMKPDPTTGKYLHKGNEIEFNYSGDDDMWVFVDGILVLDLGGIHEPAAGEINFSNGYVLTQDNAYGDLTEDKLTHYNLFAAGLSKDPADTDVNLLTGDVMGTYMRGISSRSGDIGGPLKMNLVSLAEVYWENSGHTREWKPEDPHTIKVFYLERGGSYSNLAIEFLLPAVKPLTVEKDVNDKSDTNAYADEEFKYMLYVKDADGNFIPYEGEYYLGEQGIPEEQRDYYRDANGDFFYTDDVPPEIDNTIKGGFFTLKDGQKITFPGLSIDTEYYIEEINVSLDEFETIETHIKNGVQSNYVDEIIANAGKQNEERFHGVKYGEGGITPLFEGSKARAPKIDEGAYKLKYVDHVQYENTPIYEETDVEVDKRWIDQNGNEITEPPYPASEIRFRLIRKDENGKKTPVTYKVGGKPKLTFTLSEATTPKAWYMKFTDLPSRIGRHTYTYTVEEVSEFTDYNTSYSGEYTDQITIINTDNRNVDIWAEKEWENLPDSERPDIQLVLKRKVQKFTGSEKTTLTVNVVDTEGNQIVSKPYDKDVFVGGSIEFNLGFSNDKVKYPDGQYYTVNPAGIELSRIVDDFFEVSNLQAGGNTVTITVDTGGALTSVDPVVLNHNFGASVNLDNTKWTIRNVGGDTPGTQLTVSGVDEPQYNNSYISITNRNDDEDGIILEAEGLLIPGHKYNFEVGLQRITQNAHVVLTLFYPNNPVTTENYKWLCNTNLNGADYSFATMQGEYELQVGDPAGMQIYFQTSGTKGDFRIRYITITDLTPDTVEGEIEFVDDSVTNPLHAGDYEDDERWSREVTLSQGATGDGYWNDGWGYHWTKDDLAEEPNCRYLYYIEEAYIGGKKVNDNGDGTWSDVDGNYLVTITGNGVATNDDENHMVICNKYIWYRLPETGGVGTRAIQTAGLLLITSGIMSCYAFRKRKRRAG